MSLSDETTLVGTLPDTGVEITLEDIAAAQKMWSEAVVAIGEAGDNAHAAATEAAKTAYAFELGDIQFKPTLATEIPYRPDIEGTVSYFCLLYTSPSPRDKRQSRMPSSA